MEQAPWRFPAILFWVFAVVCVPMFFVVRHFERANVFDSIGTWYTLFVTTTFTLPIAGIIAVLVWFGLRRAVSQRKRGQNGGTET